MYDSAFFQIVSMHKNRFAVAAKSFANKRVKKRY